MWMEELKKEDLKTTNSRDHYEHFYLSQILYDNLKQLLERWHGALAHRASYLRCQFLKNKS